MPVIVSESWMMTWAEALRTLRNVRLDSAENHFTSGETTVSYTHLTLPTN